MKIFKIIILVFGVILIINSAHAETLTFGAVLSLSGDFAKEGNYLKKGYELWLEEINQRGGLKVGNKYYKVEVIFKDDNSNPEKSKALVKSLCQEGIKLFLGPYGSDFVLSQAEVVEQCGGLMVQGGGAADILYRKGYKNIFGIYTVASKYMEDILKILKKKENKVMKIAILYPNRVFPITVAESTKELALKYGYKVSAYYKYEDLEEIDRIIEGLKNQTPDIIIGCGYYKDSVKIIKALHNLGIRPKALVMTVGPVISGLIVELKELAEGVISAVQWAPSLNYRDPLFGSTSQFNQKYLSKYHEAPNYISAGAATVGVIFTTAIQRAGNPSDISSIRKALLELNLETLFGKISFDQTGKVKSKEMVVVQIQKGKVKTVYPFKFAEAPLIYPK